MSDLYVSNDGFKPLLLPPTGDSLVPGRQYALTPQARRALKDRYGYVNLPTYVECLSARRAATRIRSHHENLETGAFFWRITDFEATEATFKAYVGNGKYLKFVIDLEKLKDLEPYYDTSHKAPDVEKKVKLGGALATARKSASPKLDPAWFDIPAS